MNKPTAELIDAKTLEQLKIFLSEKPRVVIITHANPDGDAIGSSLGFHLALKNLGFETPLACLDPVPEAFHFLKHWEYFQNDFDPKNFDGIIFLDCGEKKMTRFQDAHPEIFSDKLVKINIDHHPTNDNFGDINFVITDACSTAEIVFHLLKKLETKITPEIANALLIGMYTDTGSFQHQNTNPSAYATAGKLVRCGASPAKIAKNVFFSNEFRQFKLWGKVLNNLHLTDDNALIVGVYKKDYEAIGATRGDLNGVVDLINSMPDAKYSVVLSEDEKGNVKASLRTRNEEVDVKSLAEKFGGGGHVKASGFTIPHGHLQKEVKWKIVKK